VATPEDKEAALFDLLAGWAEYVEAKTRHRGDFLVTAGGQEDGPAWPYVSARWRSHYTASYLRRIRALRDMAGLLLWDDDFEEGVRAGAFVLEHLLPFFQEDTE